MKTIELTDEELGTLITALGTWMELPEEWEGEEWLSRQDAGAVIRVPSSSSVSSIVFISLSHYIYNIP
jgi:hypothetical protein